ncbi:MAG TPA: hypothetical protein VF173_19780 [Thermoanaerobaculia bacterium]|nr:hypothetical protein [Thermoanaerobaculia bacterium]
MKAKLPIPVGEDGAPVLPVILQWAFALNAGDLLCVSTNWRGKCLFQSYAGLVSWAGEAFSQPPWRFVEEWLRSPMAAMGPNGALLLPEEWASLAERPGEPLLLCAETTHVAPELTLEPEENWWSPVELYLSTSYVLPVLPGVKVALPAEALWLLKLRDGDRLACETKLAFATFEPASEELKPGWRLVEIEPGGVLSLPGSLRDPEVLKRFKRVLLTLAVTCRQAAFDVRPWMDIERPGE